MIDFRRTWLLRGKLTPPGGPTKAIRRSALLDAFGRIADSKAVLLEAPAGYGKTTAMVQLYQLLRAQGTRVGWLSLDQQDNSQVELARYLISLFAGAGFLGSKSEDIASEMLRTSSPRAALSTVLDELSQRGRHIVVFLDDLHLITDPSCLAIIGMLLAHSNENVRFILASRGRPHIDVSRLELQGTLKAFSELQLRFSKAEISSLFGPGYSDDLIAAIFERTNGWPVVLSLLLASLPPSEEKLHKLLTKISDVPDVASYLTEQVMSNLPQKTQDFLIKTSLPTRITGELANVLCDLSDGWQTIEELERDSVFIAPVIGEEGCYRYYDFFREFLIRRLLRKPEIDAKALHKKAAGWFMSKGHCRDALRHSIEAEDWDLAIKILEEEGGWRIALQFGSGVLQGIEAIPEGIAKRSLVTYLTLIYLLLHVGETQSARQKFEALRSDSASFTRWNGHPIDVALRTEAASLEAIIIVCEEEPLSIEFVERIKQNTKEMGHAGQHVRVFSETNLTIYANFDAGRYRECIRAAEDGLASLATMKANFVLGYLYIFLGRSHLFLGRLGVAQSWYRQAHNLASTHFPHEAQRFEALMYMAEAQYFQNDLLSARKNTRIVLDELKQNSEADNSLFQVAYVTAASLHARSNDLNTALSLLMEARAIARYLRRERRVAQIEIQRVEELTWAGYCKDADEIVRQDGFRQALEGNGGTESIPLLSMGANIALARLNLITGNIAEALERLIELHARAETYQNEFMKLKCLVLLSAAQFLSGDRSSCLRITRMLLSRILPTGLKRLLADETVLIRPVINFILEDTAHRGTSFHANAQIIADTWLKMDNNSALTRDAEISDTSQEWLTPHGVLSPRERDVLELLATGFSGKEIATRLRLSESTIKSYRKTLYGKLGAGRRSQALENARRMALIS